MPNQTKHKARKKEYELPKLAVGDVLLVGKFKTRKATITGFSSDANNQPVAQTDKRPQDIQTAYRQTDACKSNSLTASSQDSTTLGHSFLFKHV